MSELDKPRAQHYMFAHQTLPQIFFGNPVGFIHLLARDGDRFLRFHWDRLGARIEQPRDRVDSAHLHGEVRDLGGQFQAALITLPEPQVINEAYLIAAVYHPDVRGARLVRFFTLEHGVTIPDNRPRTVLCAWTPSKRHYNMGDGPQPEPDAFLDAIRARLDDPAAI